MKRYTAFLLLILWSISLCACAVPSRENEPVEFYYPWADLDAAMEQNPGCTAIGSEEREISGRRDNLKYLLSLYFRGPLDSSLVFPFPSGTALVDVQTDEETVTITLNAAFAQLENIDLTIACSCLAQTCFGLSDAREIVIRTDAEDNEAAVSVTIDRENYLLIDNIPETTTE